MVDVTSRLPTPCFVLDEARLTRNLGVVDTVRRRSGAKAVLALKCFSTWGVFDLMRDHLDGTTASSVHEARLGRDRFGKEVHAYGVAFHRHEVAEVATLADKVIFNSVSQLLAHGDLVPGDVGVRVNPGVSHSSFDLADPARRHSRLGIVDPAELVAVADRVTGLMFHFNCENADLEALLGSLDVIADRFGVVLERMEWVSLGGGIAFTDDDYPLDRFIGALASFAARFGVQVYLEPGEAVVTGVGELLTTVVDVVHNEVDVAVVDASLEAHLLDHLIYGVQPVLAEPGPGGHDVTIAGRTCLAGDVFGRYLLDRPLQVGDTVRVADAAGYTMVKTTWFNGLPMPAIAVRRANGTVDVVRRFGYDDYESSLS